MESHKQSDQQLTTRYAGVEELIRQAQAERERVSIEAQVQEIRQQAEAAAQLDNVVQLDNTICESCQQKKPAKEYRFGCYRSDICKTCVNRILGTQESQNHPAFRIGTRAEKNKKRAASRLDKIETLIDEVDKKYDAILNNNASIWVGLAQIIEGRYEAAKVWLEKSQPLTAEEMKKFKAYVELLHHDYRATVKDNLDLVMELDEVRKINKRYSVVREICDKNRELQQDKERLQKGIDRLKQDAEKRKATLEQLQKTNEELLKQMADVRRENPAEDDENMHSAERSTERLYDLACGFSAKAADMIIESLEYGRKHALANCEAAKDEYTKEDKVVLEKGIRYDVVKALRIFGNCPHHCG